MSYSTTVGRSTRKHEERNCVLERLPLPIQRPVQWRRLREQLAILHEADPAKVLDAAFSVGDALGGMNDERQLARFLDQPEGRKLLDSCPSLPDVLADHDALRSLPEGSLGRAFLTFCERHSLNARNLIESQHKMSRDYSTLDSVRQWMSDRFTVMHDLWHVLAGYDATNAGESALMCFSLPQRTNDRALPIFIAMSLLTGRISPRNAIEAIRRGRRARYLWSQPFEALLSEPLEAVRAQLGIDPPQQAHPRITSKGMLIPCASEFFTRESPRTNLVPGSVHD
jgi:ubiquinone biosynthesis protein COQ4